MKVHSGPVLFVLEGQLDWLCCISKVFGPSAQLHPSAPWYLLEHRCVSEAPSKPLPHISVVFLNRELKQLIVMGIICDNTNRIQPFQTQSLPSTSTPAPPPPSPPLLKFSPLLWLLHRQRVMLSSAGKNKTNKSKKKKKQNAGRRPESEQVSERRRACRRPPSDPKGDGEIRSTGR